MLIEHLRSGTPTRLLVGVRPPARPPGVDRHAPSICEIPGRDDDDDDDDNAIERRRRSTAAEHKSSAVATDRDRRSD